MPAKGGNPYDLKAAVLIAATGLPAGDAWTATETDGEFAARLEAAGLQRAGYSARANLAASFLRAAADRACESAFQELADGRARDRSPKS